MDRWDGKTAVVTGASAGIGAAVAVHLANAGLRVVGLARRPNLIQNLQTQVTGGGGGSITARACDLAQPEQIQQAFRWIEDTFGGTDVLVNNAAFLAHGQITELGGYTLSEDEIVSTVDVNLKGLILCTRHAVTSMSKRGVQGHVININSIGGHYIPLSDIFNVYPATKHAVTAFTLTLAGELAGLKSNIKVTSLSPGLVATDMLLNSRIPGLAEGLHEAPALKPADVAATILYVLSTPAHVNISELTVQPVGEKKL